MEWVFVSLLLFIIEETPTFSAYILGRNAIFRTIINSQKFFEKFVKKYLQSLCVSCIITLAVTLIA